MSLQPFVKWAGGKRQIMDKLLEFKPKKYKLLSEETLEEFYEMCSAFPIDFDDPYTDEELDQMEKEFFNK